MKNTLLTLSIALFSIISESNSQSLASIDKNPTFNLTTEIFEVDNSLSYLIKRKEELNTKIQRNIVAMELMFSKNNIVEKSILLRKYKVCMLDFSMKIDEAGNLTTIEEINLKIKSLNTKVLSLKDLDTNELEHKLIEALKPEEIKTILSI